MGLIHVHFTAPVSNLHHKPKGTIMGIFNDPSSLLQVNNGDYKIFSTNFGVDVTQAGLFIKYVTTAQRTMMTNSPAGTVGVVFDSDVGSPYFLNGSTWIAIPTTASLGTMAFQNANAVAITGGAINGTVGGTTPNAAVFTTIVAQTLTFNSLTAAGLRLNSLTTTQRDAIAAPVTGDFIFNSTLTRAQIRASSTWNSVAYQSDLGTIAAQDANNVTITGGTITGTSYNNGASNNVTIGVTTPTTGRFTTATATKYVKTIGVSSIGTAFISSSSNVTAVSTSSTTVTNLQSFAIPANSLVTNGDRVTIVGYFNRVAGGIGATTVTLSGTYSANAITSFSKTILVSTDFSAKVEYVILRTSTTTAIVYATTSDSIGGVNEGQVSLTGLSFTAITTLQFTGQVSDATTNLTQTLSFARYEIM